MEELATCPGCAHQHAAHTADLAARPDAFGSLDRRELLKHGGLAAAAALLLAACGNVSGLASSPGSPESPPPEEPPTTLTGFRFPGSDGGGSCRFQIAIRANSSQPGNAPILAHAPATYIWRAYPQVQPQAAIRTPYYGSLWWGRGDGTLNNTTGWYYAAHPYPNYDSSPREDTFWEIAHQTSDETHNELGVKADVVYNRWYTQVLVILDATHYRFYYDYTDASTPGHYISVTERERVDPDNPYLIVGDAPWNAGNEEYSGILRGWQFYDAALTLAQVDQEIARPGSYRTPWYLNLNPATVEDITDKSGNGHNAVWMTTRRPTLWRQ